jgi:hypothetical protein
MTEKSAATRDMPPVEAEVKQSAAEAARDFADALEGLDMSAKEAVDIIRAAADAASKAKTSG